jgi:hypothetical protein
MRQKLAMNVVTEVMIRGTSRLLRLPNSATVASRRKATCTTVGGN